MKVRHILAAAMFGLGLGASAAWADDGPGYTILEEGARVGYPQNVSAWDRADGDDALLLRVNNDWYLARLNPGCTRGANMSYGLVVDTAPGAGIDNFTRILIDNRSCRVRSVARVALDAPH